jgi:hypothetical protein
MMISSPVFADKWYDMRQEKNKIDQLGFQYDKAVQQMQLKCEEENPTRAQQTKCAQEYMPMRMDINKYLAKCDYYNSSSLEYYKCQSNILEKALQSLAAGVPYTGWEPPKDSKKDEAPQSTKKGVVKPEKEGGLHTITL